MVPLDSSLLQGLVPEIAELRLGDPEGMPRRLLRRAYPRVRILHVHPVSRAVVALIQKMNGRGAHSSAVLKYVSAEVPGDQSSLAHWNDIVREEYQCLRDLDDIARRGSISRAYGPVFRTAKLGGLRQVGFTMRACGPAIDTDGPARDLSWVVNAARRLASTVQEIHQRNVSHGDIKPENVLFASEQTVGQPDHVVLIDFGLAGFAEDGRSFGTPIYLPPEERVATDIQRVRARRGYDVYALCMTFADLFLTGRVGGSYWHSMRYANARATCEAIRSHLEVLRRVLDHQREVFPEARPLIETIARGVALDPEERWPSVLALSRALQGLPW